MCNIKLSAPVKNESLLVQFMFLKVVLVLSLSQERNFLFQIILVLIALMLLYCLINQSCAKHSAYLYYHKNRKFLPATVSFKIPFILKLIQIRRNFILFEA